MLGKLCRLVKHCGHFLLLTKIDQARRNRHCKNKTQDEGLMNCTSSAGTCRGC
jgi:hypothetical protein